jgi:hypothetical protein
MRATSAAPVANVFSSKANEMFPDERVSAITPEPTTAARRNAVPTHSATNFFADVYP